MTLNLAQRSFKVIVPEDAASGVSEYREGVGHVVVATKSEHQIELQRTPYRDVHYYVIICPAHCLLIGYDVSQPEEKMNMFIFFVVVESKPNRSRIAVESQL